VFLESKQIIVIGCIYCTFLDDTDRFHGSINNLLQCTKPFFFSCSYFSH